MRVVILLAIAACGHNIELDPNVARSGTRLKLVRYDYGEGAREIDTQWFHDAVRDERCTPRQWFDGVTICTPGFTDTVFPTSDCNRPPRSSRVDPAQAPAPACHDLVHQIVIADSEPIHL